MKVLRRKDVAQILKCSQDTVDRYRKTKGLPWSKEICGTTEEALFQWIDNCIGGKDAAEEQDRDKRV